MFKHTDKLCCTLTVGLIAYGCCIVAAAAAADDLQQQQQPLSSLLMLDRKPAQEPAERQLEEKHKFELKRRLHKLIDEYVDSKTPEEQQQQQPKTYPKQQQQQQKKRLAKTKKSYSALLNNDVDSFVQQQQQQPELQQQQQPEVSGDQKIIIIVKQQPSAASETNDQTIPIKPGQSVGGEPLAARRLPSAQDREHMRRILADGFNIRKESLFTGASNQLNLKGGPSSSQQQEEEY